MTTLATRPAASPRNLWRSAGAILLGFIVVFVLSLGTDQLLHVLQVYPPWGEPMHDPGLNLLALSYRLIFGVVGGYVCARFAPRNPVRHAVVLGALGMLLSGVGAAVAIRANFGPSWYPILLALSSIPTAWLGGVLYRRNRG
ncbi:MAG TPA: hypothetical protein VJ806_02555 [Luteimonas sp.]|nr:hypothetical protein [Luteimonas sp.]